MKQAKSPSEFIDLSFLSAEEEAAIRQVLLRNEDLNRLETGRIRKLRQSVPDLTQLKTLSGEWFEELRAERYGQRTDVTAVVRSSMRWKKTAAHKSNPFLNKIAEEKREGENETCTTPSHISADPRLIHPALSQETYRQYTDEDFMEDGPAGKSSSENIETSNGHKLIFNTDPKKSLTEKDSKSVNAHRPVLNGTEAEHNTTETQPKDFSGDRTTRNVQLSSEVQEQPKMKSERTAKKDATDAEPRRKISLPPALQKDHSFEENWVKISLEPNQMKPVQDESKSVGHKLKEVNNESFVMGKKSDIQDQLFPNKKKVKVMDSHASDITVKKDLETSKSKEKIKPSSDQNPPRDTPLVLSDLSKEHLFMTDDTTLEQSDVTLHINAKHNKEPQHEDKEKVKTKPSSDLKQPEYTRSGPNYALPKLSKDHLAMTDDRKLVHSEDVTWQETAFKTTGKGNKSLSEDAAGTEQAHGSSETKAVEGDRDTDQKAGSNILLSVLARAHKTRPPILQKISAEELKQEERDDKVPMIVIVPSESPDSKQKEENKNEALVLEASAEGFKKPSYTTDAWEDEGVDSDDDSSLSSYGSELSSRKGRSASTLSLTDSTKEDILNKVGNQTAVAYIHFYCMDPKPTQVKRFLLPTFIFFCVLLKFIQRTGSLLSVYSEAGDFGNVQVQGSVEFALMYSPVGELIIMIEQCQDLAFANTRKQRTDPYVKTYLYPDKTRRSKKKTSVKKRTVNPVYVESLRYKVKREELPEKTLNLSVWHNDSRGRNVFLGQVEISFKNWDWAHEALSWYNLQPKNSDNPETQESHGSLLVSLKYVSPEHTGGSKSSSGEIHVWLREAKELRRLRPQGVDSFVKCYVLPDTRKKSRQKTRVIKKTQDPVYNHTMVYDGFTAGEVTEACCELTVWDHNTLSNQFLGGLRLSLGTGQSYGKKVEWMDSMNEEVQIWTRMLANPNSWVDGDLPLRSSMTPRK